jgi:hypothetical protein
MLIETFKKLKSANETERAEINALLKQTIADLKNTGDTNFGSVKERIERVLDKALKEQEDGMNFIRDKVRKIKGIDGKRGLPGKNADEEVIVGKVLAKLPPPKEEINGEKIVDKINELNTEPENQIGIEHIKGWKDELDKIRSTRVVGGGTSQIGVAMALANLLHTETPTGDVDGVNKVYTTTATISKVMSFGINGDMIHSGEYSISGNTITFTDALPADLSGTSFEITYF